MKYNQGVNTIVASAKNLVWTKNGTDAQFGNVDTMTGYTTTLPTASYLIDNKSALLYRNLEKLQAPLGISYTTGLTASAAYNYITAGGSSSGAITVMKLTTNAASQISDASGNPIVAIDKTLFF